VQQYSGDCDQVIVAAGGSTSHVCASVPVYITTSCVRLRFCRTLYKIEINNEKDDKNKEHTSVDCVWLYAYVKVRISPVSICPHTVKFIFLCCESDTYLLAPNYPSPRGFRQLDIVSCLLYYLTRRRLGRSIKVHNAATTCIADNSAADSTNIADMLFYLLPAPCRDSFDFLQ